MMRRLAIVASLSLALAGASRAGSGFDPKIVAFTVTFHEESSAYRDTALVAMPGAAVIVHVVGGPAGDYEATTEAGILMQQSRRQWRWTAPDRPGTYLISVDGPGKKDTMAIHAFVMVPATEVRDGLLNGYRIGEYPASGNPLYRRPAGFIEVTAANEDTKVSPHFRIKQFLCQEDTTKRFPKYVLLKERLPLKLEAVLERVNVMGFDVDTLHVMSAFRTPYYNHAIGDVPFSMHQWGSAADIYIDPLRKDRMADVNHDGQVDIQDSKRLYDEIEQMLASQPFTRYQGGMGFYPGTSAHPPFVHVDVRGTAARWKG